MSFFKVLHNPRDVVSWLRLLLLVEGIVPKTARTISGRILEAGDAPAVLQGYQHKAYGETQWQLGLLLRSLSSPALSSPALSFQQQGLQTLVPAMGEAIYTHYRPLLRWKYLKEYPRRAQELENFLDLLGQFRSVEQLLSDLALEPVNQVAQAEAQSQDEAPLVLSTIHSAKGLEWHTVFLIHALDGIIPSSYVLEDARALDEELRLLYVALTRAQQELYVCYPTLLARRNGEGYLTQPSRFLQEVSQESYERFALH
jgi:DNA helicase-2/ATP-dependent DNA helicase PcrA